MKITVAERAKRLKKQRADYNSVIKEIFNPISYSLNP
jgi:hypothetical protein